MVTAFDANSTLWDEWFNLEDKNKQELGGHLRDEAPLNLAKAIQSSSRVAVTDPYPLSTLLQMQGGNTFKTILMRAGGKQMAESLVWTSELVASNNIELPPCCDSDEHKWKTVQIAGESISKHLRTHLS
ncbi:hypothetical protein DFH08DRAFT_827935 [Mycena albidolilacea]|uniref:Uncharacterized protein n=1 Tax=Mycena albidolilacea TaxID=1033008 RepID=A0AAD6YX28_9AGAR|nr:hypothetical protein DFH08DRAFT_827935 [Mycena albidolilacea]